ncbi:MAG: hypothetical protein H6818_09050 [Phycisphaerales bacterium]|nr:hypothetical protein [Phycisphaerales bacterium]MCB9862717.1 hypothetical protein [Phycisphaerales bacterium]
MEDNNLNILREIEENERWLASIETPAVSAESIAGVKRAVRNELANRGHRRIAFRWRAWQGATAAAAMLLLSVGVVRYSMLHTPSSRFSDVQIAMIELPVIPDVETSIDGDTLDALGEMSIGESWALSGSSMYETFEDALSDDGDDDAGEIGAMGPVGISDEAIG